MAEIMKNNINIKETKKMTTKIVGRLKKNNLWLCRDEVGRRVSKNIEQPCMEATKYK